MPPHRAFITGNQKESNFLINKDLSRQIQEQLPTGGEVRIFDRLPYGKKCFLYYFFMLL
jgi:hypothetical protein